MNGKSSSNRRHAIKGKLRGAGHRRSEKPASNRKPRGLQLEALEQRQLLTAYIINTSTDVLTANGNTTTQINGVTAQHSSTTAGVDTWVVKGNLSLNSTDTLTGTGSNALYLLVGNNVNIPNGATISCSASAAIPARRRRGSARVAAAAPAAPDRRPRRRRPDQRWRRRRGRRRQPRRERQQRRGRHCRRSPAMAAAAAPAMPAAPVAPARPAARALITVAAAVRR